MNALTITDYERPHRTAMLALTYESHRTHSHLDWHTPVQWLESNEHITRLVWQGEDLVGFIALSKPQNSTSWLRLLAISHTVELAPIWQTLWSAMQSVLNANGIREVYILLIDTWLSQYLMDSGFSYTEDVVTLYRPHQPLTPPQPRGIQIELAYSDDLDTIVTIDHNAFVPPWQLTCEELRQAIRQASSSTLARYEGQIVGYQISTRHHQSGHLARLAVNHDYQGLGIGAHLLAHLIDSFERRQIKTLTVNTQRTNWRSQRLYNRYGFRRNGFDLAVWCYNAVPV